MEYKGREKISPLVKERNKVYFKASPEGNNSIFDDSEIDENIDCDVYGFNDEVSSNEFEEVRIKLRANKLIRTLKFHEDLEDCKKRLTNLIELNPKAYILILSKALVEYYMHEFEDARKLLEEFNLLIDKTNGSEKIFAKDIIEKAKSNLELFSKFENTKDGLNIIRSYFIGGKKEPNEEFLETNEIYQIALESNENKLKTVELGNIIYLINSFLYSEYKELIDSLDFCGIKNVIINCHGSDKNDYNIKISFKNGLVEINFIEFYNYLRIKYQGTIIVLGCYFQEDKLFKNIIYYANEVIGTDISKPFIYSYLLNLIYFMKEKESFELAISFCSLYSDNYKNLKIS